MNKSKTSFFKKLVTGLHPDKPIYMHWLLWGAVVVPAVIAFVFARPLMEGLNFSLTKEGYSLFLSTFKFPLWLLSGSIVFSVIVARFHFSLQRSKAIDLSEKNLEQSEINNHFKMYYEHKGIFNNFVKDIKFEISIHDPKKRIAVQCGHLTVQRDKAYSFFFPENSPFKMHADFTISDIENCFKQITADEVRAYRRDNVGDWSLKHTGVPFAIYFDDINLWPAYKDTGLLKEVERLLIHSVYKVAKIVFNEFAVGKKENDYFEFVSMVVDENHFESIGLVSDANTYMVCMRSHDEIEFILERSLINNNKYSN